MNKKIVSFFVCMFVALLAQAEEMKFVTMLSQPVGVFKQVDLVDASKTSTMNKLIFCQKGSNCQMTAKQRVVIPNNLTLEGDATTLKADSTVGVYYVNTFVLRGPEKAAGDAASLTAKGLEAVQSRLVASKIYEFVDSEKFPRRVKIHLKNYPFSYNGDLTSRIASFNTMTVTGTAVLKKIATETGAKATSLNWQTVNCADSSTAVSDCAADSGKECKCESTIRVLSGS